MFLSVFTLLSFCIFSSSGYFGQPLSHGVDDLFDTMGQATLESFDINEGNVLLDIETGKTIGKEEIWVLDFQPYDVDGVMAVVTNDGGVLKQGNTGSCSNIFNDVAYDDGFYSDDYEPNPPGEKELFTSFVKGSVVPGQTLRKDNYIFVGDIDSLFACQNTNNESVWVQNVYTESIEFNTTLYMTNVRPKYPLRGDILPSYVESYAVLYWRLLRIALSRFLISSTERLKPVFQYAIVTTVYTEDDPDNDIDRSRAEVELAFKTITDSDGELISVFKYGSFVYSSANPRNSLSHIKLLPDRGCNSPLGMENGTIQDSQITASGTFADDDLYAPYNGRLNMKATDGVSGGAWIADSSGSPYLQVDLLTPTPVAGVITQGRNYGFDQWVETYQVQHSNDGSTWEYVKDYEDNDETFPANFDSTTQVTNFFANPVSTRYIRILPLTFNNQPSLRIELLGCPGESTDLEHLDVSHTPTCDFTDAPGQCTQQWYYKMVLNVDETSVTNDKPIDATGNFQFKYETYKCDDLKTTPNSADTCELLDVPDAIISHEVTLQSTVQLIDGEEDSPSLVVKQVYGKDNSINLVGGYKPGVSHLETVTVEIAFFPEFLRSRLELDLTLFMVCIGSSYKDQTHGCLMAPESERYAAYVADDFYYEKTVESGPVEILDQSSFPASAQVLESQEYIHEDELYRIRFINKALSGQTRDYTITTVFKLVERNERRKRDIVRRDLESSSKEPQIASVAVLDKGCPKTAIHDPVNLDCLCQVPGYIYSKEILDCALPMIEALTTNMPRDISHEDEKEHEDGDILFKGRNPQNTAPGIAAQLTGLWVAVILTIIQSS